MSRPSKPARLWLRPAWDGRPSQWIILYRGKQHLTGCGAGDVGDAQRQLALFISQTSAPAGCRGPESVPIADVIAAYARDVAHAHKRPRETASRLKAVLLHFGTAPVSAVTAAACRAYADAHGASAARRQLEDLRSALKHYHAEGLITSIPVVTLPTKETPRERWLTRDEAAKLVWTAWRSCEVQRGRRTRKWTARHVSRFMLVALYTGTRAGAICAATWDQFDLRSGIFYRRPEGEAETKKRRPPVPIPARLLPHLKRWKRLGGRHPVEWHGAPVLRVSKAFARAAKDAGMPDVHPHIYRHTAATWLMQNGTPLEEAAKFLGMTVKVLEERYWHHHPDFLRQAADRIGRRPGQRMTMKPTQVAAE